MRLPGGDVRGTRGDRAPARCRRDEAHGRPRHRGRRRAAHRPHQPPAHRLLDDDDHNEHDLHDEHVHHHLNEHLLLDYLDVAHHDIVEHLDFIILQHKHDLNLFDIYDHDYKFDHFHDHLHEHFEHNHDIYNHLQHDHDHRPDHLARGRAPRRAALQARLLLRRRVEVSTPARLPVGVPVGRGPTDAIRDLRPFRAAVANGHLAERGASDDLSGGTGGMGKAGGTSGRFLHLADRLDSD
mmetsp:Transcript_99632/g.249794  ORF Transcript_99632/g.249794 Transcript_99632/m.249794 type:complete len:239 (-) Transcript_99632:583-1299(-)